MVEEVRLLASLEHPCIIKSFEAFVLSAPVRLCLVLEYVAGGDLRRVLK